MAASQGGNAKKGARRARKAAPEPGARAGEGGDAEGASASGEVFGEAETSPTPRRAASRRSGRERGRVNYAEADGDDSEDDDSSDADEGAGCWEPKTPLGNLSGTKNTSIAGGAAKPDAARVRAWRLDGRQGVSLHKSTKWWRVRIHYGEQLDLGWFKTEEDAIACRLLAEDRIAAGCHPKTGKYVPEAERPKPPKPLNNTHLLGAPAATFSDAALGERATDFAAKVDASTLDIDQVAGVHLYERNGKYYARMMYKKEQYQLGSQTADLAEAIRRRLLAEKAIALFPDKNPKDYVTARMAAAGAAGGASKKRKRSTTVNEEQEEGASAEETAPPLRCRRTRSTNEAPAKTPPTADADTDADADELRRQLAGQRNVVLALREALGRSGRDAEAHRREAEAHRREAEAHRREAEAQRQEIEAHRLEVEAHRLEVEAQRRQTERLRREVARLQAEDGQCARSRPYYWQR